MQELEMPVQGIIRIAKTRLLRGSAFKAFPESYFQSTTANVYSCLPRIAVGNPLAEGYTPR